jgi:hypothetical protein
MVQNRIQSALIIEDDSDWDVLLKSQMLSFARGVRAIQNTTLPVHSPYGDSWNLLTVGHLGVNNQPTKEQKYYVTHDDPTTIGAERRDFWGKPDVSAEKLQGNYTRYVMEVYTMRGTGAYALSLRGAARLLYDQSILPNAQPIDVAISDVCRHDTWKEPFCLGVYPPIFGLFRSIGPMDKDSDRRADIKAAKDESKEAPVEPPVVKSEHRKAAKRRNCISNLRPCWGHDVGDRHKYVSVPARRVGHCAAGRICTTTRDMRRESRREFGLEHAGIFIVARKPFLDLIRL